MDFCWSKSQTYKNYMLQVRYSTIWKENSNLVFQNTVVLWEKIKVTAKYISGQRLFIDSTFCFWP